MYTHFPFFELYYAPGMTKIVLYGGIPWKKTNPPDHIPKMHAEMEAAGIQELIDDIQSQLNEHPAKQEAHIIEDIDGTVDWYSDPSVDQTSWHRFCLRPVTVFGEPGEGRSRNLTGHQGLSQKEPAPLTPCEKEENELEKLEKKRTEIQKTVKKPLCRPNHSGNSDIAYYICKGAWQLDEWRKLCPWSQWAKSHGSYEGS